MQLLNEKDGLLVESAQKISFLFSLFRQLSGLSFWESPRASEMGYKKKKTMVKN